MEIAYVYFLVNVIFYVCHKPGKVYNFMTDIDFGVSAPLVCFLFLIILHALIPEPFMVTMRYGYCSLLMVVWYSLVTHIQVGNCLILNHTISIICICSFVQAGFWNILFPIKKRNIVIYFFDFLIRLKKEKYCILRQFRNNYIPSKKIV